MKLIKPVILSCSLLSVFVAGAQDNAALPAEPSPLRLNFLVSPKQQGFDQAAFSFQFQAVLHRFFARNSFHLVVASSSKDMNKQITRILRKKHAMIGSLWFDSHGHFTKRRSLFEIGKEEFNYETIRDTAFSIYLKKLAAYCDIETRIGIGSCYGGSTSTLPAVENFPEQRMNGDSLMMGVSHLFNNATVYACESFVLTAPGIFTDSYRLSGSPGRKKFEDSIYLPIWENLGQWNCYNGYTLEFSRVNTVSLSYDGSIFCKRKNYLDTNRHRRKQRKKLMKLKRGNYNLGYLYQEI